MLKLLNSEAKSITGAAIIISAATLMSRAVGIVRDRVFAYYFGAGPIMDAYYAAFKIPDLIYNLLIVGALTAGFIPTFTKLFYGTADKKPAWQLATNIINIVGLALFFLCGLGMLMAPWLAKIIAPGFADFSLNLVVRFTRIMLISPILLGISMTMGGILQSLRQFTLYAIAPVFYNLGIIFGATIFTRLLGLNGLAWGVVLGAGFHSALQIYGAYLNGYRWHWHVQVKDPATRLVGKLMVPRTLGLAITQCNTVIVTMLASLLPVGSVAVYNFANNLQAVPTGLIGIPFALAVFPVLSAHADANERTEFIANFSRILRQILFLIIPSAIAILLLRAQIVRVVLGSGKFDWTATIATANTLAFFALGLCAQSLIPLLARAFYALSNTKTPFIIGVTAELVSIVAALLLMRPLGVAGLALAATLGATLNAILLFLALRKSTGELETDRLLAMLCKISVAGGYMAIIIQTLKTPLARLVNMTTFFGILLHGLIAGSMGLVAYLLLCYAFKVEEMLDLHASLKRRWLKLWNVPSEISEAEQL